LLRDVTIINTADGNVCKHYFDNVLIIKLFYYLIFVLELKQSVI